MGDRKVCISVTKTKCSAVMALPWCMFCNWRSGMSLNICLRHGLQVDRRRSRLQACNCILSYISITLSNIELCQGHVCHPCRRALLDDVTNIALSPGAALVVGADKQFNAALVVSKGLDLSASYPSAMAELALAADTIGQKASFCFEAGERASRGLLMI